MSSASKSIGCHVCREGETLPTRQLIACHCCGRRYHPFCHKPAVDIWNVPQPWQCRRCIMKVKAGSGPSSTADNLSTNTLFTSESSVKMTAKLCQAPGCRNPIFQNTSNIQLCQTHKIQEQHKNATAKKPAGVFKTASVPKPFQKQKLYPSLRKLDDEQKTSKRKRSSPGKRSTSITELTPIDGEIGTLRLQEGQLQRPTSSVISDIHYVISTPKRTPQDRARQLNSFPVVGGEETSDDHLSRPLRSAGMAESPVDVRDADSERDLLMSYSTRRSPKLGEKHLTESPEYSPPPPLPDDRVNIWAKPSCNNSPGSLNTQDSRVMVNQHEASNASNLAGLLNPDLSQRIAAVQSIEEQQRPDISIQPGHLCESEIITDTLDDEEMLDVEPLPVVDKILYSHIKTISTPLGSPASTSISSSTTTDEGILLDTSLLTAESFCSSEIPKSLEAKRQEKAIEFDTSTLDSFLAKQSQPVFGFQPSYQLLENTQIWGHIDPRVQWPKTYSERWQTEKVREIEARGGRKANFGKILTAKVIKERREEGWHNHQNKEAVDDEKTAESARHLDELFGIKGIDDLVPEVRNGQLVMVEKLVDENGRRKKKAAPKIYPVF